MNKIINLLFYGGLEKSVYDEVLPMVREENRRNMTVFSLLAFLAFAFSLFLRITLHFGMPLYGLIGATLFFLFMAVLSSTIAKKYEKLIDMMVYGFTVMLLAVGVFAGVSQSYARTTLLLAFFIFSAVMFAQRLIVYYFSMILMECIYIVGITYTQTGSLLLINEVNSFIFCTIGMLSAIYIMTMRYRKNSAALQNKYLIERDTLTGTYNRRSFEDELERVKTQQLPVTICAFDINELKRTNDQLGHAAGDELIIKAAECITKIFGSYGKVFRTGGDEFVAILTEQSDGENLLAEFKKEQKECHGTYVNGLNISCGMASIHSDFDSRLSEALKTADLRMYEDKRKYYESKGMDRRQEKK